MKRPSVSQFSRAFWANQRGVGLLEILVSLVIISTIVVASLSALATSTKSASLIDERNTAKNLAESQMEYVKHQPYAEEYSPDAIPDEYSGYSVIIDPPTSLNADGDLQQIDITITRDGEEVLTLQGYKMRW